MLKAVLANSPHRDVQGAACLAMADYLKMAKERTESNLVKMTLNGGMPLGESTLQNVQKMKERGLDNVADESAVLFQFKGKPFALLGISVDDDVNELKALAANGENTWPIWCDGENLQGPLASQWVIRGMPTFFVLDQNGVIRNKGFTQPDAIEATADMLLKEIDEASHRAAPAGALSAGAARP